MNFMMKILIKKPNSRIHFYENDLLMTQKLINNHNLISIMKIIFTGKIKY